MRYLLPILMVAICYVAAIADEPADEKQEPNNQPRQKIVLEDAPRTVEDVIRSLTAETNNLDAKMAELEAKHLAAVKKAEVKAIATLKGIAKFEVSNGQLKDGIAAWTEVVKLAPEDDEALKFFESIGRKDVIDEAAKAAEVKRASRQNLERIEFVTESGSRFKRQPNGLWSHRNNGKTYPDSKEIYRDDDVVIIREIKSPNNTRHLHASWYYLEPQKPAKARWVE
ncbi:MAG: hypothetical protein AAGA30_10095 [Planctomycetota bacterium]